MEDILATFHPKHLIEESGPYSKGWDFILCIICGEWMEPESIHFCCRICDFHFHKECPTILMESYLTINRPETHEHTLTFIRKRNSFNCDACGEVGERMMNMYVCLQCNFFVHRTCMNLPKVIKLTRHSHRMAHTFQVSDCNTNCRLCDGRFVCGYGGYICTNKTCDYKLHSYCATDREVWDGKDVEREPEEITNSGDVASSYLEEVDGKTIRHFSHQHDLMRLCVNDEEEDNGRLCQACILPIDFDSFLCCKECDFALHETCARLPRNMEHALHRHQLILQVDMMNIEEGFFTCSKCERKSCGFMYRCCQEECKFKMDAKCASLADPLYNGAHQHPLTLLDNSACCYKCPFNLGFKSATLPVLVKCKYDTHPLTLFFSKSIPGFELLSTRLWCEICEEKIDQEFYACTDCNIILHVECLIGYNPYMKPGHTIKLNGFEIEIASNSLSRQTCHGCHQICRDKKLVFISKRDGVYFCSINCVYFATRKPW